MDWRLVDEPELLEAIGSVHWFGKPRVGTLWPWLYGTGAGVFSMAWPLPAIQKYDARDVPES